MLIASSVIFNNLNKEELAKIAKIEFTELEKRLNKKNLKLRITDEAISILVERSFDHIYGARPLKRIIKKEIETKIANNILNNHYFKNNIIEIFVEENNLIIN